MSADFWWQIIKKYPERVIIAVLILIIVIIQSNKNACRPVSVTKLPKQSISLQLGKYVPKIIKIERVPEIRKTIDTIILLKYITNPQKLTAHDSAAIAASYLQKIYYDDTLFNSPNLFVRVQDSISQNRIIWRYPTITYNPVINPVIKQHAHLYGGIGVGGWSDKFGSSGKLLLITKNNRRAYQVSIDPFNRFAEYSMFWVLF